MMKPCDVTDTLKNFHESLQLVMFLAYISKNILVSKMTEEENIVPLPLLIYASPTTRLELFAKKIKFCCQLCNFDDAGADIKKKETKRIYLNECVEFLKDRRGVLIEPIYALTVALFAHNIFRALPDKRRLYNPDLDENVPLSSWPHVRLVYLFFIRVLESADFQSSVAKKFIDHSFMARVIESFASDDHKERECLRTTLHRLYAKFISFRAFMRREISLRLQEIMYENYYFPGVPELLEVVGSIINGLSAPIKVEHIEFLNHILLPLHSLPKIDYFHPQLVYCVAQYIAKDEELIEDFFKKFFKRWPKLATVKERLFLDELEEFLDYINPKTFLKVFNIVFLQISHSLRSPNSLVKYTKRFIVYIYNALNTIKIKIYHAIKIENRNEQFAICR